MASPEQIHLVEEAINRFANNDQMVIVDPAMADDGRLYSIYTPDMVVAMRQLVSKAHIVKPNYTEACFLLDIPFSTDPISEDELRERCKQLHHMGPEMVIMTSVPSKTHAVIAVYDGPTNFFKNILYTSGSCKSYRYGDYFLLLYYLVR